MNKIRFVSLLLMSVWAAMLTAEEKKQPTATLTIYYSNDIIGYLTPCG